MLSGDCPGFGQAESKHPYCREVVWVVKGDFDSPSQKRAVLAQHDKPASSLPPRLKSIHHKGTETQRKRKKTNFCASVSLWFTAF